MSTRHLVIELGERIYAMPARAVRGVIETLPTTPLPFVPSYVEGIAGLHGRVLPQIDLAARLDPAARGHGRRLVHVSARCGEYLLRVDRARHLVDAEPAEDAADAPLPADGPFLGTVGWSGAGALALDPDRLGLDDSEGGQVVDDAVERVAGDADEDAAATPLLDPVLVGRIGGERIALPHDCVEEVIDMPEPMALPHAPPEVLGVARVRQHLIVVVSPARLFGIATPTRPTCLVVVRHRELRLGLPLDRAYGIRRFPADRFDPDRESWTRASGCFVDNKGRPVALLRLDDMLDDTRRAALQACAPIARAEGEDLRAAIATRRFLSFDVAGEPFALDVGSVERVGEWRPPNPLPGHDDTTVHGAIDVQDEIMPVTDVARWLGLALRPPANYVIVRDQGAPGALAVGGIDRIVEVSEDAVEQVADTGRGALAEFAQIDGRTVWVLSLAPLRAEAAAAHERATGSVAHG